MIVWGKGILEKLKEKNCGNTILIKEIDRLISDFEAAEITSEEDLKRIRNDADRVQSKGFYIVNISVHRTLVMLSFKKHEVTFVWAGDHHDYERTFRNNKKTIEKWLKKKGLLH